MQQLKHRFPLTLFGLALKKAATKRSKKKNPSTREPKATVPW